MDCRRSTRLLLFCCTLFASTVITAPLMAQTAPTSEFQLDGTAAQNKSYPNCVYGPCDDWDLINGSGAGDGADGHSTGARAFINGESSTFVFIGGGSKDPNDLTSWSCTSKSSPNKDTLTNGYAVAYTGLNNDLVTLF